MTLLGLREGGAREEATDEPAKVTVPPASGGGDGGGHVAYGRRRDGNLALVGDLEEAAASAGGAWEARAITCEAGPHDHGASA